MSANPSANPPANPSANPSANSSANPPAMRIALVQLDASGDVAHRRDRARRAIHEAAGEGADLVVLPELWAAGAFEATTWAERAEPLDGPTAELAAGAARDAGVVLHAGSIIERDDATSSLFNTSLVFGRDGDLLASYRKIHRFGAGGPERDLLAPGRDVVVADLPLGAGAASVRTGLATCYDLRFPELFRAQSADTADGRAVILLLVASWRRDARRVWGLLTRARAVENQCVVVACGAAGRSGKQALAANSLVIGADGGVLAEAGVEPTTLFADVDLAAIDAIRAALPVHADRRIG